MKAIIVDDERLARNELKRLLSEFSDIEVIEECNDYRYDFKTSDGLTYEVKFTNSKFNNLYIEYEDG